MTQRLPTETSEEPVSGYVFGASATLVGVCVTLIGVFKALKELENVATFADDLLTLDATAFMLACLCSYAALRVGRGKLGNVLERIADAVFLAALCLLVIMAYSSPTSLCRNQRSPA